MEKLNRQRRQYETQVKRLQLKMEEHGYWTYDFALPMLLINALYFGSGMMKTNYFGREGGHTIRPVKMPQDSGETVPTISD